nr:hypothetical protein [Tanacetum cinerariifolium]
MVKEVIFNPSRIAKEDFNDSIFNWLTLSRNSGVFVVGGLALKHNTDGPSRNLIVTLVGVFLDAALLVFASGFVPMDYMWALLGVSGSVEGSQRSSTGRRLTMCLCVIMKHFRIDWCFAGGRGDDIEHGGENVIRVGDLEQGGENVNRGGDLVFFL